MHRNSKISDGLNSIGGRLPEQKASSETAFVRTRNGGTVVLCLCRTRNKQYNRQDGKHCKKRQLLIMKRQQKFWAASTNWVTHFQTDSKVLVAKWKWEQTAVVLNPFLLFYCLLETDEIMEFRRKTLQRRHFTQLFGQCFHHFSTQNPQIPHSSWVLLSIPGSWK